MTTIALRFAARLFFFTAVAAAILLSSLFTLSHAQNGGVDRDGRPVSSRADDKAPTAEEALKRFTVNITERAKAGQLDPFVGKREKIRRVVEVLSKRGIKTLILIGEAGSGKTALIEHASGQLEGRTVFSLNLQALMAGTTYRGMLEERIAGLLEWFKTHPDHILFIDEFKAIVEPGKEDLRNALLPPLARGEISAIMSTTQQEFTEFVEPDQALTSRGDIERLEPPTEREMLDMLRSRKEGFEKHHKVNITDAALQAAVKMVIRFYPSDVRNRKVLSIVDNTMAREVIARRLGNYDRLELENQKESFELKVKSLETDASRSQDANLLADLNEARNELAAIKQKLEEQSAKEKIEQKQMELSQKIQEANQFERAGKLQDAATLRYAIIPRIEQEIRNLRVEPLPNSGAITERHIAQFVATDRKISINVVGSTEMERLNQIAADAKKRVLFQEEAINIINERLRVRLSNVEKPRPIFIVMDGPNGVGKSELARVISMLQSGRGPLLVEANKYQIDNSSWQLLGSGVGYEDSKKGGDLEQLRLNPNQVVLVDEANLAHKSFWDVLFQLASEGMINDNRGRAIDGRNAIFLVAGNFTQEYSTFKHIWNNRQIEQRFLMQPGSLDGLSQAEKDAKVLDRAMELKGVPPGMRDRMSGKVIFNAFDLPKTIVVARLQLAEQAGYIFQEHRVTVRFAENVAEAVAKAGFDMEFNVRPIDRSRSNLVSVLLADISQQWKRGDVIEVNFEPSADGKGGKLTAKINGADVPHVKDVVFKSLLDPQAAAARAAGEAGRQTDPTDPRENAKRKGKRGRR